jgi:nucleotide-binding universal stress UspA family protein
MKKILIAVDDTKGTQEIFNKAANICKCMAPDEIFLLYVERLSGPSILSEMGTDAELSTLREVLEGTEYKQAIDARAQRVIGYYKDLLEKNPPVPVVRTIIKSGRVADMILETAKEQGADLIFVGARSKSAKTLFMGSVSREVSNRAEVPVLIVK